MTTMVRWKPSGIEGDEHREPHEGIRGFVERWHKASMPESLLVVDPFEWIEVPQQPDFSSCGVLVIAQVHNYLTENVQRQHHQVTKNDVKVMRLRFLWTIMCYSQERRISDSDAAITSKINQQLLDQL